MMKLHLIKQVKTQKRSFCSSTYLKKSPDIVRARAEQIEQADRRALEELRNNRPTVEPDATLQARIDRANEHYRVRQILFDM